jgi:hypothetical protein
MHTTPSCDNPLNVAAEQCLVERFVETVRETSTEWIGFTHCKVSRDPQSGLSLVVHRFEMQVKNSPNPPRSGLKGI